MQGLDVGEASRKTFADVISAHKTILWNGPLGVFEFDKFSAGTKSACEAVAAATKKGAVTIIGGGDTATAAAKFGMDNDVSHCSTGGGASLELLEGNIICLSPSAFSMLRYMNRQRAPWCHKSERKVKIEEWHFIHRLLFAHSVP